MDIPKYIYVDDENDESIESLINGFNDTKLVYVERLPLSKGLGFSELINSIIHKMEKDSFSGLLIDLRLDGEGPDRLDFSAVSISSELRVLSARRDIISFPIILCSTINKIKETYKSDKTSHDLFDYTFKKAGNPDYEKFSKKLRSLAFGYQSLSNDTFNIGTIFSHPNLSSLDQRIFERFHSQDIIVPYDIAHFTVKTLFHCTNPLIKETTLAARLGIDISKSKEAWRILINEFENCKYSGLFSDGWDRWWSDILISKLKEISGKNFSFLKAEERVSILKEIYKVDDLVAAVPIRLNASSEYWTICEALKSPLDPLEGIKIKLSHELKPWQEPKYMSLFAYLERIGIEKGIEPHYTELARIEELKKNL
jgi:hypothetical protein